MRTETFEHGTLYQGDCLDILPELPPGSVDAILTDLPYGSTECSWDSVIPFAPMWDAVKHVLKPDGTFVTTASQPFTSALVMSNPKWFRYEWIWDKRISGNPLIAKFQPLKTHENILIFSKIANTYNPVMWLSNVAKRRGYGGVSKLWKGLEKIGKTTKERFPVTILSISNGNRTRPEVGKHPTQKPVALYKYLVLTYTNPGDTVLDMCMGSGTTMIACMDVGREWIGIEKVPEIFETACTRIHKHDQQLPMFPSAKERIDTDTRQMSLV